MSNANPSRLGQVNGAGDSLAIFLKVFAGEVLDTFDRSTVFKERHTTRTIPYGKSAQFPATGIITPFYHTPGAEILGEKINANERVINVEGLMIAPAFVSNIDDFMNHYDYRAIYGGEIGQALAKLYDQNVARSFIAGARATTPNVNGVFASDALDGTLTLAGYATSGSDLLAGIKDANVLLDQRDVPADGRFAAFRPVQYALIVADGSAFNWDYNPRGNGSKAEGMARRYFGAELVKTNNLPNTDDRTATNQPSTRQLDFSVTQGLVAHGTGAGTVQLQDVTMESEYDMRRQGWLMLGKYLTGHDYLRPEASVELQSGAPS